MADWDSAYLLRRFKQAVGLQDASDLDDTTDLYPYLARGQERVFTLIGASGGAKALYQPDPTAMTPAGDGKTYTFGVDGAGNPIVPMGWVQIAPTKAAFQGDSFYGWIEGQHFIDEGYRIRIPGDRSSTKTLYWRGVPTPPAISASQQPILHPAPARELIVIQAKLEFGEDGALRDDLVASAGRDWSRAFAPRMTVYRRRYQGGGALLDPARWYLNVPDFS